MSHGMWTRTSPERLWSWSDRPYYTIPESRQKYVSLNDWTSGWIPPTNCSGTRVSCPEDCCLVPCPGALSDHSSGHPHTHLGALHCGKPPSRAGLGFFALVFLWFGPVPQQPLAHLNRPVASNLGHPRAGPNTTLIRTFVAYRCLGGGVWGGGLEFIAILFCFVGFILCSLGENGYIAPHWGPLSFPGSNPKSPEVSLHGWQPYSSIHNHTRRDLAAASLPRAI